MPRRELIDRNARFDVRPFQGAPSDPEFVKKTFRPLYLKAMKSADEGDFSALTTLHEKYEKK